MLKRIAILGSTGSIGTNSLRVIEALGPGYEITALSGHSNVELLAEQVRKYKPRYVAITDEGQFASLKSAVGGLDVKVLGGADSIVEISGLDEVDVVLSAVVGVAGLEAILAAAENGKILAIANKEPLVVAGELLCEIVGRTGAKILPVDSEHSAIFQAMQSGQASEVSKLILTASGGPFRNVSSEEMEDADVEQVLAHPTWDMGAKITVDSATMMNKALEVIEAHRLFDIELEKIEVLIHPESIVHSLVEFIDGSVIAQMGTPDMCLPIQYALTYPKRLKGISRHLKLDELGKLTFEKPDVEKFRAIKLGYEVGKAGGLAPAVLNAANEAAVEQFLAKKIRFKDIIELIEYCLSKHKVVADDKVTLDRIFIADESARKEVVEWVKQKV